MILSHTDRILIRSPNQSMGCLDCTSCEHLPLLSVNIERTGTALGESNRTFLLDGNFWAFFSSLLKIPKAYLERTISWLWFRKFSYQCDFWIFRYELISTPGVLRYCGQVDPSWHKFLDSFQSPRRFVGLIINYFY